MTLFAHSATRPLAVSSATAVGAMSAYAVTAARTITWWDGSSYPLAAATLGIPGAPGSLLLTLLGWVVVQFPMVHPIAFRLNLFAALISATLAALITWLSIRLATPEGRTAGWRELLAGALAGWTFAFAVTPWTYAVQMTPYGLTALFTALILITATAWWRRPETSSGRWPLFLLFLLFGLDISVHRTNLLILPAALLWIAIRHPHDAWTPRNGMVAVCGMAVGLAFHLFLIPLALRHPLYMVEAPVDLPGWWSYVSLEVKGGGFLVQVWPRTAELVGFQLRDYLSFLARNLSQPLLLPIALAALGWVVGLREHPRRALGWATFFLCAGLGAVVYFNLPRSYMRSIDRHYLPSLVIAAPWIGVGAAFLLRRASRPPLGPWLAPAIGALLMLIPLTSWLRNHSPLDHSRVRFTEHFARDVLETLPERAILLTNGDNDTLPLWYMQWVEGVRPDVTVINLPCVNLAEYVAELRRRHPDLRGLLAGEPERGVLPPLDVADTTVTTVVEPRTGLGLPAGMTPPDSVVFRVKGPLYGSDRAVLDILRLNRWRRPVMLAITVSPEGLKWIWPHARLDGLAHRVIPTDDPAVKDLDSLREHLLVRIRYTDMADTTIPMDAHTRLLCRNYAAALLQLALAQVQQGQPREALETLDFLERKLSVTRLGMEPGQLAAWRAGIESEAAKAVTGN